MYYYYSKVQEQLEIQKHLGKDPSAPLSPGLQVQHNSETLLLGWLLSMGHLLLHQCFAWEKAPLWALGNTSGDNFLLSQHGFWPSLDTGTFSCWVISQALVREFEDTHFLQFLLKCL